ncbi:hypothetical protein MNBD_NITROSPINAE04-2627 [hydrothermal vent metagenome]|uniref:Serine aminopeptidase S33 domain-containing protein n=1 Tax=hydrothermal vent metagenome TaxID=652676 RepID=A0A3B1CQ61_9ZZZZ
MLNKGLLLFALFLALAAVSLRAVVKIAEPKLLFHPQTGLELNPPFFGLSFVDVVIRSGEFNIHGWFFPGDRSKKFVIFYHGNAGNMSDRLAFIKFMKPAGLNFLMIDYRGYGRSEGWPTIDGTGEDAVAAVDWMSKKRKVPLSRIVLWGRSLGVGAALVAAERYPGVAGVILESGFVSMRRMASEIYPFLPVAFVTDGFDNGRIVSKINAPKLFIHGTQDQLIPFRHAEELYLRALGPKRIVPVVSGHNDTYIRGGSEYLRIVEEWISGL